MNSFTPGDQGLESRRRQSHDGEVSDLPKLIAMRFVRVSDDLYSEIVLDTPSSIQVYSFFGHHVENQILTS